MPCFPKRNQKASKCGHEVIVLDAIYQIISPRPHCVLTVNDPRHPIMDNMMVMAPSAIKTFAMCPSEYGTYHVTYLYKKYSLPIPKG
jgi:hypothetical protein